MQKVTNKIKIVIIVIMGFFFVQCSGNLQQQSVTVTGSILGEDGAYTPVPPVNLMLTHNPEGNSSLRVIDSQSGIQNQKSVNLLVERTGIPLTEEYWFMNISRLEPRPDFEDEMTAAAAGDIEWLRDHVGDLSLLGLRPDMIDSPLSDSIIFESSSLLRLTGHNYLCRVQEDDVVIPFNDPSSVIDISRLTGGISSAFGTIVTTAVNNIPNITLGGPGGAGDFKMYFVPHVLHSALSDQRNIKGIGFVFRFTANVTIGVNIDEFMVYIPISILMEPVAATGGGMRYEVFLDPLSMIGVIIPPDNLNRITVTANGLFDSAVASEVRNSIVDAMNNIPQNNLDQLEQLAGGLAALINSFHENNPPIPDDWDVMLLPQRQLNGNLNENLISPAANGLQISLVLLEK
jgi:hypothetical protein